MKRSPRTLSVDDRRIVASWAADCAEHVLAIFQDAVPDDGRVHRPYPQVALLATRVR